MVAAFDQPPPADLWPLFAALDGLPVALIRGANSDLLSAAAAAEMRRRRPDMIFAEVPGRGHIPFLDEPEALAAIDAWLGRSDEPPAYAPAYAQTYARAYARRRRAAFGPGSVAGRGHAAPGSSDRSGELHAGGCPATFQEVTR